jgi:hypothetical protein
MSKIVRTPTRATGGITPEEKARLDEHARMWIARAMRTEPIDPDKIVPAIKGIYAAAGLKEPRVVIVPSPLVMAFAYGASAAIWHGRGATASATYSATRSATYSATRSATDSATDSATYIATDRAERHAENACRDIAGKLGLQCAENWYQAYQGGNMWAGFESYLTAMRDVIGLRLPEHEAYAYWEQAAIHGGFRVMHSEFCIVSDFPEFIHVDENNEPHCETGPSHRWRDGWELYHWHGVRVPGHWIMSPENVDPAEILGTREVEVRAAGISIVGMARMLDRLDHEIIDSDPDPLHGDLISVTIPDLPEPVRYLSAHCPRNGRIMEAVPNNITSVIGAQAWRVGIPVSEFQYPEKRT